MKTPLLPVSKNAPFPVKDCDVCGLEPAVVDAKTVMGPWANLCPGCWRAVGTRVLALITNLTTEPLQLEA